MELKPCPFCNGVATVMHTSQSTTDLTLKTENYDKSVFWVKCSGCQVSQYGHADTTTAKEEWNKRTNDA